MISHPAAVCLRSRTPRYRRGAYRGATLLCNESFAATNEREGSEIARQVIMNHGPDGHRTVGHMHLHVMAGRPLGWPPG